MFYTIAALGGRVTVPPMHGMKIIDEGNLARRFARSLLNRSVYFRALIHGFMSSPRLFLLRSRETGSYSCRINSVGAWIMLNRLLNHLPIYFLPPFLLAMEWLLRQAMGVDSHEFAAPTIAAAGLGLMLPLTVPKDRRPAIGETTQREMKTLTASITSVREQIFISVVWMGILFSIVSWTFCLVKSCKPNALPFGWPHMPVALALYVVSIILSELKESV